MNASVVKLYTSNYFVTLDASTLDIAICPCLQERTTRLNPSSDDNNTMDEHNYDRPDLTPHDVALTDPDHFLYRL